MRASSDNGSLVLGPSEVGIVGDGVQDGMLVGGRTALHIWQTALPAPSNLRFLESRFGISESQNLGISDADRQHATYQLCCCMCKRCKSIRIRLRCHEHRPTSWGAPTWASWAQACLANRICTWPVNEDVCLPRRPLQLHSKPDQELGGNPIESCDAPGDGVVGDDEVGTDAWSVAMVSMSIGLGRDFRSAREGRSG